MIRFAPAVGLLLASPVVIDALRGRRGIDEALMALLIGVAAATLALWLLQWASRSAPGATPPAEPPAGPVTVPVAPTVTVPPDTGPGTVS